MNMDGSLQWLLRRNGKMRSPMPCGIGGCILVCAVGMVILFGVICFFLSRALSEQDERDRQQGGCPWKEGDLSARKESDSIVRRSVI